MFFQGYFNYLIFMLPAIILSIVAQIWVKSSFAKYSQKLSRRGITGKGAAQMILSYAGINDVSIYQTDGRLTDNYNPASNSIALSRDVYEKTSISAIGVAAHEAGHALQHASNYPFIALRSALVPSVNFASSAYFPMIFLGYIFSYRPLILIGIIFFSLVVLFSLVTLPVEINASNRAIKLLRTSGILEEDELVAAKKVLLAAAMTYLASVMVAIWQLLRLILIYNNRGE